jgi:hypothetical protein
MLFSHTSTRRAGRLLPGVVFSSVSIVVKPANEICLLVVSSAWAESSPTPRVAYRLASQTWRDSYPQGARAFATESDFVDFFAYVIGSTTICKGISHDEYGMV